MKNIRLVKKNLGDGGCDFYETQTRAWYFPFWTTDSWSLDFDRALERYNRLTSRSPAFTQVILEEPDAY